MFYVFSFHFYLKANEKRVKSGTTEQSTMATKNDAAWFTVGKDATIADERRRKKEKKS